MGCPGEFHDFSCSLVIMIPSGTLANISEFGITALWAGLVSAFQAMASLSTVNFSLPNIFVIVLRHTCCSWL
jgi:hypothetical protein